MRAGIIALATAGVLATSAESLWRSAGARRIGGRDTNVRDDKFDCCDIVVGTNCVTVYKRWQMVGRPGQHHHRYRTSGVHRDRRRDRRRTRSIQVQPIGQAPNMHVAVTRAPSAMATFPHDSSSHGPTGAATRLVSGTGQVGGGKLTGEIRLEDGQYLRIGNPRSAAGRDVGWVANNGCWLNLTVAA